MPYTFSVLGWQDDNDDRHEGQPSDLSDTFGLFVAVQNVDNNEDVHYFWSFMPQPFEDWADWWDYIEAQMDMYGYASA